MPRYDEYPADGTPTEIDGYDLMMQIIREGRVFCNDYAEEMLGGSVSFQDQIDANVAAIALKADETYVDTAIVNLKDGVGTSGDTLRKLDEKIISLETWKALLTDADEDDIINTITEMVALFDGLGEDATIIDLLNEKISFTDIIDNVVTANSLKPLSANQGKVLKDLIDAANIAIALNTADRHNHSNKTVIDLFSFQNGLVYYDGSPIETVAGTFLVYNADSVQNTAANLVILNPIIADGAIGIETDTGKTKNGDGVTAWNSLQYGTTIAMKDYVDSQILTRVPKWNTIDKSVDYTAQAWDAIIATGTTEIKLPLSANISMNDCILIIFKGIITVDGNGSNVIGETSILFEEMYNSAVFMWTGTEYVIY